MLDHIATDSNGGAATVCGHCGVSDAVLLLSMRHRGTFLRLCATCVLRLHPHSFCPTCLDTFHHPSPPPKSAADVTCSTCFSVSHSSCVGPDPQYPYICPLCSKPPNVPFFKAKKVDEVNVDGVADDMVMSVNGVVVGENAARVLAAAAAISSDSMCKAALAAKSEAERRAREAVNTRKRARHALEHMALVVANEKMKMRKGSVIEGNVRGGVERMDGYCRDGVGNGGGGVLGGARSLGKDAVVGNLEGSNEVFVEEINAVECREKGVSGQCRAFSIPVIAPSCSNGTTMDVHAHRDMSLDGGDYGVQKHDGGSVGEMSSNPDQLNQSPQRNPVSNNGVVRNPPMEDQVQGVEDGHPELNNNCLKQ